MEPISEIFSVRNPLIKGAIRSFRRLVLEYKISKLVLIDLFKDDSFVLNVLSNNNSIDFQFALISILNLNALSNVRSKKQTIATTVFSSRTH